MRTSDKVVVRFHASNMLFPSITTALLKKCGFYFEGKVTGTSAAKPIDIITFETHLCGTQRYKKLSYRQEVDVMRENKNEIIFLFEVHLSLALTFFTRKFLYIKFFKLPLLGAEN